MNYQRIYNKIIANAKLRNSAKSGSLIVETHHIIPRHCGGNNLKENKVNLTLREHFVCHVLLTKIYKETEFHAGMCRAVVAMSERGAVSSKLYQSIREQHISNLKNQVISAEQKLAISQANTGNKSRTGMKNSPEHIEILRLSRLGSKHSDTTKARWSQIRKGRPAHNAGLTGDASPLFRIAKPKITCPHCNKEGGVPAMKRFHFENCNFKKVMSYVI
jgi:hypothetical protein